MELYTQNNLEQPNEIIVGKNCNIIDKVDYLSGLDEEQYEKNQEQYEKNQEQKNTNKITGQTVESRYIDYTDENFKKKLGKYTFGLDKIIPWEDSNFIFSGGLLYDIVIERFSYDMTDIDLFFYGPLESKISTINKLLDNLDNNQYSYFIGHKRAVIYLFIQGIPRIIQLVMTDQTHPENILNQFDLTHIMSYSDGNKLYCSPKAIEHFEAETIFQKFKSIEINFFHKNRIIKYIERGIIDRNIMLEKYNWILNKHDTHKYISAKEQTKLYKSTYCLTRYYDGEPIDFKNFDKNKLNLYEIFGCVVNYNKLYNHNFMEGIDMFGSFAQYMGNEKNELLLDLEDLNENVSSRDYCNFYKYELAIEKFYSNSKLFFIQGDSSIYIPCNFMRSEESIDYNYNQNKKQILKIYFDITDKNISSYLKTKINKNLILDSLNYQNINFDLVESKYKMSDDQIYMPFNTTNTSNNNNSECLEICSKLYNKDIEYFLKINEFGILDSLESGQSVNCLFDILIYLSVSNNPINKINYVDINLKPRYIYKTYLANN